MARQKDETTKKGQAAFEGGLMQSKGPGSNSGKCEPGPFDSRTSYQNLYMSLGRDPSIKIGRIEYIDLKKNYAGVNDAFWRKRKSFEHEREVRALLLDFKCQDLGKIVPCDLEVLIEEVFVSPKAPPWFVRLVNDVNEKYGVTVKVSPSELVEEPFF